MLFGILIVGGKINCKMKKIKIKYIYIYMFVICIDKKKIINLLELNLCEK